MLNKEAILAGVKIIKEVEIKSLGGFIKLKPLTSSQYAEVQGIKSKSIKVSPGSAAKAKSGDIGMEMDLQQTAIFDCEAKVMAVRYAISVDESWTTKEVESLPPDVLDEIAKEVFRISRVDPDKELSEVEKFCEQ